MNRGHEVLAFDYDPEAGVFLGATDFYDRDRAPLGLASSRGKVTGPALAAMTDRLPFIREGMERRLRRLELLL